MKRTMPAYNRYGGEKLTVSSAAASTTAKVSVDAAGAIGDGVTEATSTAAASDVSVRVGSSSRSCWINNR